MAMAHANDLDVQQVTSGASKVARWTDADDVKLRRELEQAHGQLAWTDVALKAFPNGKHSPQSCHDRWQIIEKAKIKCNRGPWLPEEDERLLKLVSQFGPEKWTAIASDMGTRTGKQCRERWHNHLDPTIVKTEWTSEEEQIIVDLYERIGSKWAEMAKHLPGRPDNAIKNHFNAALRNRVQQHEIASVHSMMDKHAPDGVAMARSTSAASFATSGSAASPRFAPYARSTPMSKSRSESVSSMGAFSPLRASGSMDQFASPSSGYSASPYMSPPVGMVRSQSMMLGAEMASPSSQQRTRRVVGRNLARELSDNQLVYVDEMGQAFAAPGMAVTSQASAMLVHGAYTNSLSERPTFLRHHHSKSTPVVPTHSSLGSKPSQLPPLPAFVPEHEAPLMTADSGYGTSTWDDVGGHPGGLDYDACLADMQLEQGDLPMSHKLTTSVSTPHLYPDVFVSPQHVAPGTIAPSSIYVDPATFGGHAGPYVHPDHFVGNTDLHGVNEEMLMQFGNGVDVDWYMQHPATTRGDVPANVASPSLATPIEQFAALHVASPTVEQGPFEAHSVLNLAPRPGLLRRGSVPVFDSSNQPGLEQPQRMAPSLHKSNSLASVANERVLGQTLTTTSAAAPRAISESTAAAASAAASAAARRNRQRNSKPSSLSIATTLNPPISLGSVLAKEGQSSEGEPTPRSSSFPSLALQAPTAAVGRGLSLSTSLVSSAARNSLASSQGVPRSINARNLSSLVAVDRDDSTATMAKTPRGPASSSISLGPTASWTGKLGSAKVSPSSTANILPTASKSLSAVTAHPTSNLMSVDQHGRACLPGIS
ncbi:hypothetical protein OIV83_002247 [Microbotryomycetes sp. JL201]|nr:hypothetical protein OIV83_002247 [Microbotryomycetes sp. JL201]